MKHLLQIIALSIVVLSNIFPAQVMAQNDSELGRFSSDFVIGCAPLTINLSVNDNFGNIVRQYIYEEGAAETNDTFHTYTSPGTYEIVQIIQSQTPRTDRLTITVIEPETPQFEIFNCSNNGAKVSIIDDVYDFYRVYFLSDSVDVAPGATSENIQFPNSNTQSIRIRGFLNNAPNNCGETSFNFDPIATISTPEITDLEVIQHCVGLVSAELDLSINSFTRHEVQYSTDGINYTVLDTIFNQSTYSRTDIPVNGREVCFRLVALDECAQNRINSAENCAGNLSLTMPAVSDVTASFNTNGVSITWEAVTVNPANYTLSRAPENGSFNEIGNTAVNAFTDSQTTNGNRIFDYQIVSADTCGNSSSPSLLIRPIFLRATERTTNNYDFAWNDYNGWNIPSSSIEYSLEVLDEENSLLESFPILENNFTRNISQDADRYFRISAFDPNNNRFAYSNIVILDRVSEIIIPTAFTPNGDGLNDVFSPIISEAESFEMKIFNRWGELIFFSNSIFVGWDGRYKSGIAQSGTYIYQISLKEENGESVSQRGTFQLIK
ncbi:MAG: gliding motility-associated C-terminal domain-containing protein [Bacteroidota bacterium]